MNKLEKLGSKCTSTICHKECPIYYFNNEGAGGGCHNNCMETLRFPTVAAAVDLWINGKSYDKKTLHYFGDEDQEDGTV